MGEHEPIAAGIVEPRGIIRSVVAGAAVGDVMGSVALGIAAGGSLPGGGGSSPIRKGQLGYVAVYADRVVLFAAKRGAFRGKPTDDVLASAPRTAVAAAHLKLGRIAGVLEIDFADGSAWAFDIPKIYRAGAEEIVAALAGG